MPGAVGYIIRRSATEDVASSKMIDSVGADVSSYSDTVSAAVPYYYWVAAAGRYGTGYLSSGACGFVVRPPAFGISNREAPMLVITWIRHARALRYKIYRSRNDTLGFALRADVADTTYTDTANDCAVYYYRMSIETVEGTSLFGDFVPVTSFLDPPAGFTAVEYDAGVLLKWRPVTGADGFILYRSTLSTTSRSKYREIRDTLFFDTIAGSDRYYYTLATICGGSVSATTATICAGRIGNVQTPVSFSATGRPEGIFLAWSIPDGSSNPEGVIIYRSLSSSGTFTPIDTAPGTSYCDSVADFQRYYYRIAAYNSRGVSAPTPTAGAQRLPPTAPANVKASLATSAKGIIVSWSAVPGVKKYGVYRNDGFVDSKYEFLNGVEGLSYFDTNIIMFQTYYYLVTSYLPDGTQTGPSDSVMGRGLGRPSFRKYTVTDSTISLTWEKIWFADRYYIYRKNSPDGQFVKIDSLNDGSPAHYINGVIYIDDITTATYVDRNPLTGVNYYKISAWNTEETRLSFNTVSASTSTPGTFDAPNYESLAP